MKEFVVVLFVAVMLLVLLSVTPLLFLWSVNSLFGLTIPYNFHSILAAWALLFVIRIVTRTEVETIRR